MEEVVHVVHVWAAAAGPWLVPFIGLSCFLKYVFPPFPSDSVLILGAALSVDGRTPASLLFSASMAGSLAGIVVDYGFGRWLDRSLAGTATGWRWLPQERLGRLESGFRRWGAWFLVLHRILPIPRALIFVFSGLSRLGATRTLVLGSISTAAGHAVLIWATAAVRRHIDRLTMWEVRTHGWLGVAVVVVVAAAAGLALRRLAGRRRGDVAWRRTGCGVTCTERFDAASSSGFKE